MYDIINTGINLPEHINFIILTHSEEENGKTKLKTIGKLLDDKVILAGLFTVVLYTDIKITTKGVEYSFITNMCINNRGIVVTAKSPRGMFKELYIPNDLGYVIKKVNDYYNGE